ncbi:hypothetical protein Tco_0811740, partial [Tanacetum coccineum]
PEPMEIDSKSSSSLIPNYDVTILEGRASKVWIYHKMDKNEAKRTKPKHGNGKSLRNQSRRRIHP